MVALWEFGAWSLFGAGVGLSLSALAEGVPAIDRTVGTAASPAIALAAAIAAGILLHDQFSALEGTGWLMIAVLLSVFVAGLLVVRPTTSSSVARAACALAVGAAVSCLPIRAAVEYAAFVSGLLFSGATLHGGNLACTGALAVGGALLLDRTGARCLPFALLGSGVVMAFNADDLVSIWAGAAVSVLGLSAAFLADARRTGGALLGILILAGVSGIATICMGDAL